MEWKEKLPKRSHTVNIFDLLRKEGQARVEPSSSSSSSLPSSLFWDDVDDAASAASIGTGRSSHDVPHSIATPCSNFLSTSIDCEDDEDAQAIRKTTTRKVFGQLRSPPRASRVVHLTPPEPSRSVHLSPPECVEIDASQDSDIQDISHRSPVLAPRRKRRANLQDVPIRIRERSRSPALVTRRPRVSMIARSDAELAAALQQEEVRGSRSAGETNSFGFVPTGREWLYVIEPCARPARCRGCNERINRREPRVFFQHARQSKVSSAHVGCLAEIAGLIRPARLFSGASSAEVMMSAQFQPADRAAIEAQLSELPPGPSEGGQGGEICHFEWPPPVRPRPSVGLLHGTSTGNVENLQQRLLRTDRDFSADDYEMLLELDEQAKSSKNNELEVTILLSQMPVTRVPASGSSRCSQCSICLENMEVGEEVRTLPCMHIFHRACIDKWVSMPGVFPKCPIDQKRIEF